MSFTKRTTAISAQSQLVMQLEGLSSYLGNPILLQSFVHVQNYFQPRWATATPSLPLLREAQLAGRWSPVPEWFWKPHSMPNKQYIFFPTANGLRNMKSNITNIFLQITFLSHPQQFFCHSQLVSTNFGKHRINNPPNWWIHQIWRNIRESCHAMETNGMATKICFKYKLYLSHYINMWVTCAIPWNSIRFACSWLNETMFHVKKKSHSKRTAVSWTKGPKLRRQGDKFCLRQWRHILFHDSFS